MEKKTQYSALKTFCLRTPLFPFSFYRNLTKKSHITDKQFQELLQNTILREAIHLASPELGVQLQKWQDGHLKDQKKIDRLQSSLLKYTSRISTRCTPFGLFASCASGSFADETKIKFHQEKSHSRSTRFDMSFLSQLQLELLKDKNLKEHLIFYPNTSLYAIENHFRYIEYTFKNKRREYSLEGFTSNEYLKKIIKEATSGRKISELASCITDNEITSDEAIVFIHQLIDSQILVSELELTVTGEDYFQKLLTKIQEVPESN